MGGSTKSPMAPFFFGMLFCSFFCCKFLAIKIPLRLGLKERKGRKLWLQQGRASLFCATVLSGTCFFFFSPASFLLEESFSHHSNCRRRRPLLPAASLPSIEEDDCQSAIWRLLLLQLLFFGWSSWCNLEKHRRLVWSQVWPFYFFYFFLFSSPLSDTCSHPHHLSPFLLPCGLVPHSTFFLSIISGPHRWIPFCFHPLVGPLVDFLSNRCWFHRQAPLMIRKMWREKTH